MALFGYEVGFQSYQQMAIRMRFVKVLPFVIVVKAIISLFVTAATVKRMIAKLVYVMYVGTIGEIWKRKHAMKNILYG